MSVNWEDLRTILAVVRRGTLAGAAEDLELNYTSVARRIARAEEVLGLLLFEKHKSGYVPTDAARIVARHAGTMQETEHGLMRELVGQESVLSGPLVVTAPQLLIAHVLAPMLDGFVEAYPDVDLQVRSTNALLDLNRREADLAIRISRDPGDTLKGMRLAEQETAAFATPDWAARVAEDPEAMIDWVVFADYAGPPSDVLPGYPNNRVRLRLDDMGALLGAARAGIGVVRMPVFLGRASGLVQMPVLAPKAYAEIWVVAHRDVWGGARSKAFRDQLVPFMRARRAVFLT